MFKILSKIFIKSEDYHDSRIRTSYGILCSILSILCNLICVIFKIIFGYFIHSYAMIADGLNNLSDIGSNVASLIGFKLSSKYPDTKHPFGHGRYEYLAGFIIGILITLAGAESLISSIKQIIHPADIIFSIPAILVMVISVMIKLWVYRFNHYSGTLIESQTLIAVGKDSLNDVITSVASLIVILCSNFVSWSLDGLAGVIVSIIVLKNGIETIKEMINALLGQLPDPSLVSSIESIIVSHPEVLGYHDFMLHDYGAGGRFLILHVEVDHRMSLDHSHEIASELENKIEKKYSILTTIHIDPVDLEDSQAIDLYQKILKSVKSLNQDYTIHDFRVIRGRKIKIIFEVEVKNDHLSTESIKNQILDLMDKNYEYMIRVEHSFSG